MPALTTPRKRAASGRNGVSGDKRALILKAATKIFARHGFFHSQVADVAKAAGVAAGTVYLYFGARTTC